MLIACAGFLPACGGGGAAAGAIVGGIAGAAIGASIEDGYHDDCCYDDPYYYSTGPVDYDDTW